MEILILDFESHSNYQHFGMPLQLKSHLSYPGMINVSCLKTEGRGKVAVVVSYFVLFPFVTIESILILCFRARQIEEKTL